MQWGVFAFISVMNQRFTTDINAPLSQCCITFFNSRFENGLGRCYGDVRERACVSVSVSVSVLATEMSLGSTNCGGVYLEHAIRLFVLRVVG
jgi:hypothetical protein